MSLLSSILDYLPTEWGDPAERVKTLAALVASVGGTITAVGFFITYLRDRKRAHVNMAREVLATLFSDTLSRDALRMLDWEARKYPVGDQIFIITNRDVINGLRTERKRPHPRDNEVLDEMQPPGVDVDLNFTPEEQYVRDCFERLYDQFDSFEHFIGRGLLNIADLRPPLAYYVKKINAVPEQKKFLTTYDYTLTLAFLAADRFPPG
jgi:hypothetical protein